jgi:hypothetical protein
MEKKFQTKKQLLLLLLLTVIQCKQCTSLHLLQCYRSRSGFKTIFSISKASKFSIMQG